MSFQNFRDFIKKAVKDVISEPAMDQMKEILRENVLPFMAEELNLIIDSFFPEIKEKATEAISIALREAIKKELVPEFDNKTLSKLSTKVSNSVMDKVVPKIMERIKRDLLTEEFIVKVLNEIFSKPFKTGGKVPAVSESGDPKGNKPGV